MDELPTPPNPFVADGTSTALVFPSLLDLFFWPGDWAIYLIQRYLPALAAPLGLGADSYGGRIAMLAAFAAWLLLMLGAIMIWSSVRNLDRAVTRGTGGLFAELRRRVRMALVIAKYRRDQRNRRAEPAIEVDELPGLSREELRVLELHARVMPGYALAVSDVAEEMRARGYQIRGVLEHLQQLKLLQSTVGGLDGETAYTLSPAGRAVLQHLRAGRKRR